MLFCQGNSSFIFVMIVLTSKIASCENTFYDIWRIQNKFHQVYRLLDNHDYVCMSVHLSPGLVKWSLVNPLPATSSYLNFRPDEVVSRYRDPQYLVGENYSYLYLFLYKPLSISVQPLTFSKQWIEFITKAIILLWSVSTLHRNSQSQMDLNYTDNEPAVESCLHLYEHITL